MFHYTKETHKSLEETIAALEQNLQAEKFGILWQFDMKAKLLEKGLDFDPGYRILEVCNPHEAKRALSENMLSGYFLPCKIVVFEDHGTIRIGLPKPTELIGMMDNDVLEQIAQDVEKRLISCIDQSV